MMGSDLLPQRPGYELLPPGLRDGADSEHMAGAMELLVLRNFAAVSLTAQARMTRLSGRRADVERIQTFEMGLHRLGRTMADMTLSFDRLRRRQGRGTLPLPAPRMLEVEQDLEIVLGGVVQTFDARESAVPKHDPNDDPRAEFERRLMGYYHQAKASEAEHEAQIAADWGARIARINGWAEPAPPSGPLEPGDDPPDEPAPGGGPGKAPHTKSSVRMPGSASVTPLRPPGTPPRPLAGPRIRPTGAPPLVPWNRPR